MTMLQHGMVGTSGTAADTGDIGKSVRFRNVANPSVSRTFAAGNRKTWTWSGWVKRGVLASLPVFSSNAGAPANGHAELMFSAGDTLYFGSTDNNVANAAYFSTSAVFRDPSAHYHIVCVLDTTNATAADRIRIFVNGVRQPGTMSAVPTLNSDQQINRNTQHVVGHQTYTGAGSWAFDGYMSRICFVDGQALDPTSFGYFNTDTNTWVTKTQSQCKAVVDAGGTNSFMLDFDNGTSLTTLGYDKSTKGNNWTLNNISLTAGITYDWMEDTPSNNFAVLNPLDKNTAYTAYAANLSGSNAAASWRTARCTIPVQALVYAECSFDSLSGSNYGVFGVLAATTSLADGEFPGRAATSYGVAVTSTTCTTYNNNVVAHSVSVASGASTIFQVAVDRVAGKLWLGRENTWFGGGDPATGTSPTFTFTAGTELFIGTAYYASSGTINFGQAPLHASATWYADAGGYFRYAPPAGLKALCTKNLTAPAIMNPENHFDIVTRVGDGTSPKSISGVGFSPNLVWSKARSEAFVNGLADSVRGVNRFLVSNSTIAETVNEVDGYISAFLPNGYTFTAGTTSNSTFNKSSATYVDWLWKAGGDAVTNTAGSITSQVSANQQAGFSIVTYTGTGANATVGHGLGVAPKMVVGKSSSGARAWVVWHSALLATEYLNLNLTNAKATLATLWNSTLPSTTVVSLGSDTTINTAASVNVLYCFAEIPGFSRIGSYTGNGSADGPFVWCGFRPKWVMFKRTDVGAADTSWNIIDTARNASNVASLHLNANQSAAESTYSGWDFLSNGFKIRNTGNSINTSGGTYIFLAFADTPFKYANAR